MTEEQPPGPPAALSPTRASDFMQCPLLYRFRVVDRLPEPPSQPAARGTVVHTVLERLFDRPAGERTLAAATALLPGAWDALLAADPEVAELFADDADGSLAAQWLDGSDSLLATYFDLEDPNRLEPAERELYVAAELGSGLVLRGYVDRLDVAPDGAMRVVDYKTGKSPPEGWEQKAMFQMRCYALVLWRMRGQVPRLLQLVYLRDGQLVRFAPDEADLRATENKVEALWRAISQAHATGVWRPRRSRLCDWCSFRELCPEFGGTPPPLPDEPAEAPSPLADLPSAHAGEVEM